MPVGSKVTESAEGFIVGGRGWEPTTRNRTKCLLLPTDRQDSKVTKYFGSLQCLPLLGGTALDLSLVLSVIPICRLVCAASSWFPLDYF